jgi:signal transduction histidine kinase
LLLSFLLGAASMVNLWCDVGKPFGGFLSSHNITANSWPIGMPTPTWWPGIIQGGVAHGDRLVELDGQPYGADQDRVYAAARARGLPTVDLVISRAGTRIEIELPVVLFTTSNFLDVRLPTGITGLGFWLLAVVIYRAQPAQRLNRLATAVGCLMAIAFWLPHPGLFPDVGLTTRVLDFSLYVLAFPLLGAALTHFALLFPDTSYFYRPLVVRLLYFVSLVIAAPYAVSRLLLWTAGWSPLVGRLDRFAYKGYLYFLGLGMGLALLRLAWTALRPGTTRRLRRQAIIVILGLLAILPAVSVTWLKQLSGGSHNLYWHNLDLRYLYLAVPLAFTFVVLRYQAFRNVSPLFLAVLVLFSASLLASIGAWWVRVMQPQPIDYSLAFLPILGVNLAIGAIWSAQGSWRGAFGRLLQWEVHSYGAARRFGQRVLGYRAGSNRQTHGATAEAGLTQLPARIVQALVTELELERAAIWLWREGEAVFDLASQAGRWPQRPPGRLPPPAGLPLTAIEPLRVASGGKISDWLSFSERAAPVEVVVLLSAAEQPIGLLALGQRWDEEIFDERDLEIVELIAQQVSLFLLTARQIQELRQVPRRIAQAQERERARIAQELHDTVQQFLGGLPFYLETSRDLLHSAPDQADAILHDCLIDATNMAQTVHQIRDDLAPGQLETDFAQAVADLAGRLARHTGIEVQVDMSPDLDSCTSLETRHGLYRVVQQALDNVAAHARAQCVHISLRRQEEKVTFVVADDGRGSSESQRAQARAAGSFGLQSMQDRIQALGGEFHYTSVPGQGTQVAGWVPADVL